jgi:hypothetical protein
VSKIRPVQLGLQLFVVWLFTVVPATICLADDASACDSGKGGLAAHREWGVHRVFDGSTLYAWRRTWHGPNSLDTPLTGFYVPRTPACCDYNAFGAGCGEVVSDGYLAIGQEGYHCPAAGDCYPLGMGLECRTMERLGQIPNDLDVGGGLPVAAASR